MLRRRNSKESAWQLSLQFQWGPPHSSCTTRSLAHTSLTVDGVEAGGSPPLARAQLPIRALLSSPHRQTCSPESFAHRCCMKDDLESSAVTAAVCDYCLHHLQSAHEQEATKSSKYDVPASRFIDRAAETLPAVYEP